MSSFGRIFAGSLVRRIKCTLYNNNSSIRAISTSNKKDDTTAVIGTGTTSETGTEPTHPRKLKYFQDYGFEGESEAEETILMHSYFFLYITLVITLPSFYFLYRPQTNLHDWARREAYLELRRREHLGLPLIDPNYVDPSTVYLPSDEELGDTEIII